MDHCTETKLAEMKKQYDELTSKLNSLQEEVDRVMDDPRLNPAQRDAMLARFTSEARMIEKKRRAIASVLDALK